MAACDHTHVTTVTHDGIPRPLAVTFRLFLFPRHYYSLYVINVLHDIQNVLFHLPPGFADDYALLIAGLLDLYEAGGGHQWLEWALQLQDSMDDACWDAQQGKGCHTSSSSFFCCLCIRAL